MSHVNWKAELPESAEIAYENRSFGNADPSLFEDHLLVNVGNVYLQLSWSDSDDCLVLRFLDKPSRKYIIAPVKCSNEREAIDAVRFFAKRLSAPTALIRDAALEVARVAWMLKVGRNRSRELSFGSVRSKTIHLVAGVTRTQMSEFSIPQNTESHYKVQIEEKLQQSGAWPSVKLLPPDSTGLDYGLEKVLARHG